MTKLKGNVSVAKQMYSIFKNAYYIPKQSQETYPKDARLPQCHITGSSYHNPRVSVMCIKGLLNIFSGSIFSILESILRAVRSSKGRTI